MHPTICRGARTRFFAAGAVAFLFALSHTPRDLHATPIVFRVFNLGETTAYVVQKNAHTLDTEATTPHGVFDERIDAVSGDRIILSANEDFSPPVPPTLTSALASNGGECARLVWTPSGDLTVAGYVVSYGVFSVERGQAMEYTYSIEVGPITSYDVCGLAGNTYYFAVQAVNYVGQLSAYSIERSIEMTTAAVLISRFDARATRDAVQLSWDIEADETILGYRLYRRGPGSTERLLLDAPLPPTARAYADTDVRSGTAYTYTLAAIGEDGSEFRSAPVSATTPALSLALEPNAPNPFRNQTRIPFTLAETAHVTVRVYDVRGALVATLFDGTLGEGRHEVGWGGHDLKGNLASSGIYFCALNAGKHLRTQKMLLVK